MGTGDGSDMATLPYEMRRSAGVLQRVPAVLIQDQAMGCNARSGQPLRHQRGFAGAKSSHSAGAKYLRLWRVLGGLETRRDPASQA